MNSQEPKAQPTITEAVVLERLKEMEIYEPGFWEKERAKNHGPEGVVKTLLAAGRSEGISVISILQHEAILRSQPVQQAIAGYLGLM